VGGGPAGPPQLTRRGSSSSSPGKRSLLVDDVDRDPVDLGVALEGERDEADVLGLQPAQVQRQAAQLAVGPALVDGEVAGHRLQGPGELQGVAGGGGRQGLAQHRAQEVLLPRHPVEVTVEQPVAHPHVLQRQVALEVHPTLVPLHVLLGVVDRVGDVDVDASDGGGQVAEAGVVDDRHVVEPQPGEVLDRAPGAEGSVGGEGLVDLVASLRLALGVVDLDPGVAWHGHDVRRLAVGRDVEHHHGVAAVVAGVPLALGQQLGDGRLLHQLGGVVGPHQQDVERLGRLLRGRRPLPGLQHVVGDPRDVAELVVEVPAVPPDRHRGEHRAGHEERGAAAVPPEVLAHGERQHRQHGQDEEDRGQRQEPGDHQQVEAADGDGHGHEAGDRGPLHTRIMPHPPSSWCWRGAAERRRGINASSQRNPSACHLNPYRIRSSTR
jgi:hypothetical protein